MNPNRLIAVAVLLESAARGLRAAAGLGLHAGPDVVRAVLLDALDELQLALPHDEPMSGAQFGPSEAFQLGQVLAQHGAFRVRH